MLRLLTAPVHAHQKSTATIGDANSIIQLPNNDCFQDCMERLILPMPVLGSVIFILKPNFVKM